MSRPTLAVALLIGATSAAQEPTADPFKNVPPVRALPRPGQFQNPPTGPGYHSVADLFAGQELKGPPKYPYPRFSLMQFSFFDTDFRYLDDPKNTERDLFDCLKRQRFCDDFLFTTGGDYRTRFHNEYNSRLGTTDNNYDLNRVRAYGDLWYRDQVRVYAEFLGAWSSYQSLAPLAIDQTGADILNLFTDLKLGEYEGKPVYARLGRQELLLGSQRLVSPLEWANTRRTFQGTRVLRTGEKWDFDAFWLQPVVPQAGRLDWADNQQNFAGTFVTHKPRPGTLLDLYALVLDNGNPIAQQGLTRAPLTIGTFGSRYTGDVCGRLLFDFEGGVQLGNAATPGGRRDVVAGFSTAGLGYTWADAPTKPTVWLYYDYASGDHSPNDGRVTTFNQLYPFGHNFLGWTDLVGRQNIHDLNVQYYMYPANWLTLYLQYHRFWLDSSTDALYGIAGNASRRDATGLAGRDVGREVDVVANVHITKHADILVGYSYLFGGDFLQRTAGPGRGVDSSVFFLQTSYRW